MSYEAAPNRYDDSNLFARAGKSGLDLPRISLGLWHNFGGNDDFDTSRGIILGCFDRGITHFDLANNYGPPAGSAEITFGRLLERDLGAYRHELVISTKAGYYMWPGPYGEWGSRKYLLSSLDASLKRMGLEYVDIFYSHRPDPKTPLEETCGALAHAVRSGKALYVGISNYDPEQTRRAAQILRELGTPCLIHQPRYSMYERTPERGLFDVLSAEGIGCIAFSPLAQGLLSGRYLAGIPADARAAKDGRFLSPSDITEARRAELKQLDAIARERGQTLAQLALSWVLRNPVMTSALIGASRLSQVEENLKAISNTKFDAGELERIERVLSS
jgi:L-glyceraldehyde 3-phosphate reductase